MFRSGSYRMKNAVYYRSSAHETRAGLLHEPLDVTTPPPRCRSITLTLDESTALLGVVCGFDVTRVQENIFCCEAQCGT